MYSDPNKVPGRGDAKALHCFRLVDAIAEQNGATLATFKETNPKGFRGLDSLIGGAFAKICIGELGRETIFRNDVRIAEGRQTWYIRTTYYATGNNVQAMYSMNGLQKLLEYDD